jgi:mannan endo-1,4-beta-mannosidase
VHFSVSFRLGSLLPTALLAAACGSDTAGDDMPLGSELAPGASTTMTSSSDTAQMLPGSTTAGTPPYALTAAPTMSASAPGTGTHGGAPNATATGTAPNPSISATSDTPDPSAGGMGGQDGMGGSPTVGSSEPDPTDPTGDDPDPTDPDTAPTDTTTDTTEPEDSTTDPGTEPSGDNQCEGGALAPGFYVNDGRIYDDHCAEFVMRGVNYPYVWFKDSQSTQQMFADIAATSSNVVRVVLATGGQWPRIAASEISSIIGWAKENKLVAILEVHDSTGYGDKAEAVHPDNAVDYWLSDDIKAAITGQEAYVMINIANEAFGNDASSQWESFHTGAVADLRAGGLKHTFIVDAPNWGQDWTNTMRDGMGAKNIFAADPDANTVFSVHMYDVYGTSDTVWAYFENFLGLGVPLLVGEFAADHGTSGNVDEAAIMAASKEHNVGYLGWSWSGNSSDLSSLDLVQNFNGSAFSTWGQRLIDGADGIRETSEPCRCFE